MKVTFYLKGGSQFTISGISKITTGRDQIKWEWEGTARAPKLLHLDRDEVAAIVTEDRDR